MSEIRLCDRCDKHAAVAEFDDNWGFTPEEDWTPVEHICIYCAPRVSRFHQASRLVENIRLQRDADATMLEALTL